MEAVRTAIITRGEAAGVLGLASVERSGGSGSLADVEEEDETNDEEEILSCAQAEAESGVAAKESKVRGEKG